MLGHLIIFDNDIKNDYNAPNGAVKGALGGVGSRSTRGEGGGLSKKQREPALLTETKARTAHSAFPLFKRSPRLEFSPLDMV
jgi:hypothetical protein